MNAGEPSYPSIRPRFSLFNPCLPSSDKPCVPDRVSFTLKSLPAVSTSPPVPNPSSTPALSKLASKPESEFKKPKAISRPGSTALETKALEAKPTPLLSEPKLRLFSLQPIANTKKLEEPLITPQSDTLKRPATEHIPYIHEKKAKVAPLAYKLDLPASLKTTPTHFQAPPPSLTSLSDELISSVIKDLETYMRLDTERSSVAEMRRTLEELGSGRESEEMEVIREVNRVIEAARKAEVKLAQEALSLIQLSTEKSEWFLQLTLAGLD